MPLTLDEMLEKINNTPEDERETVAETLLSEYEDYDKELIEPYVWEMVASLVTV